MFEVAAYAAGCRGQARAAGSTLVSFLPLVLIFVVFYFLLIRPQQKKMKQHREMIAAIRRGDRVADRRRHHRHGDQGAGRQRAAGRDRRRGAGARCARGTISEVLAKTEPAKGSAGDDDEEEEAEGPAEVKGRSAKG